jgi:hypothetical protein
MRFKDFITRQRVGIFVVGAAIFVISLTIAHISGFSTLWGELFVDLAASAVTIIFTALIIDYLGVREESIKTHNAAGLAEDELKATCFRLKWRMARLFGLERKNTKRPNIGDLKEAKEFLSSVVEEVDNYLAYNSIMNMHTPIDMETLPRYLERLQLAQIELEQMLILYEYALPYSLRERVLHLRSELQTADHLLGFIDMSEKLSESNLSLVRVMSQSIYESIEEVLGHHSRTEVGVPLSDKDSPLA